jgi:hypothetical protein
MVTTYPLIIPLLLYDMSCAHVELLSSLIPLYHHSHPSIHPSHHHKYSLFLIVIVVNHSVHPFHHHTSVLIVSVIKVINLINWSFNYSLLLLLLRLTCHSLITDIMNQLYYSYLFSLLFCHINHHIILPSLLYHSVIHNYLTIYCHLFVSCLVIIMLFVHGMSTAMLRYSAMHAPHPMHAITISLFNDRWATYLYDVCCQYICGIAVLFVIQTACTTHCITTHKPTAAYIDWFVDCCLHYLLFIIFDQDNLNACSRTSCELSHEHLYNKGQ